MIYANSDPRAIIACERARLGEDDFFVPAKYRDNEEEFEDDEEE